MPSPPDRASGNPAAPRSGTRPAPSASIAAPPSRKVLPRSSTTEVRDIGTRRSRNRRPQSLQEPSLMMPVALGTSKHDGRMTIAASLRCNGQWRSAPSQSKSRQRELPRDRPRKRRSTSRKQMRTLSLADAVALIPDGASLMIGGFMAVGTPESRGRRAGAPGQARSHRDRQRHRDARRRHRQAGARPPGEEGDRQPHRPESRDPGADDRRRDGGRPGAAGHADRTHPRRRLRPRRHPHRHRRRHGGRGRQAEGRRWPARTTWSRPRCAPTSRWSMPSSPTTSATSPTR